MPTINRLCKTLCCLGLFFSTAVIADNLPDCTPPETGKPLLLTEDCQDPRFNQPYTDIDEWRETPFPHRYIHGGFTGTDARFSFYFPAAEEYEGRFFQNTHQLLSSEDSAEPSTIGFALDSGGYYVQTNLGGVERATTPEEAVSGNLDPAVGGYRVNAAAAQFSRQLAVEMYGHHRPHGYLYGGSGGAFQTIVSAQNTIGIWDGYVPFVMGTPNAIPGVFTARIHTLRVLRQGNKFPGVMDAINPGGSGDPYAMLNDEEAGALREATRLGFPPRGWWRHPTLTGGPLRLVAGYVPLLDPDYFTDFWTEMGYLGTDPNSSVGAARIQYPSVVGAAIPFPPFVGGVILAGLPAGDLTGADLLIDSGPAAGQKLPIFGAIPVPGLGSVLAINFGADPAIFASLAPGNLVRVDNSDYLALQTYHRHQVPSPDLYGWDQFRDPNGEPIYPQRDVLVGPIGAFNGAGDIQNGHFYGKMIAVQNLMDIDAFPWGADWYRSKVIEVQGWKNYRNKFRLYFTDHADHTSPADDDYTALANIVQYRGVLQQALRDVSAWVEKGKRPPASTRYEVDDNNQVQVPRLAAVRKGIQPVVHLWANGSDRAEVEVGEAVHFHALIGTPPGTGKIVDVEWDFMGVGNFPDAANLGRLKPRTLVSATHVYDTPGTYIAVLRATSHRDGDATTPYARVQNLGRVRVVVK